MQGGSASGISMTAYVLISLLENKNNFDVSAFLDLISLVPSDKK